jgi:hypothetical protein
MKKYLSLLFLSFLFIGCKKEYSEDETYGYEAECQQCDINYVDDLGTTIYVNGHKGLVIPVSPLGIRSYTQDRPNLFRVSVELRPKKEGPVKEKYLEVGDVGSINRG